MTISEDHLEKIRHCCKLEKIELKIWRNYFITEPNTYDDKMWKDLVVEGYAELGISSKEKNVYFASEKGIRAALPIIIKD